MQNGDGSSSISTQQLVTPAAGNLKGLMSRGAGGGGDKPHRHPGRMKSVHELDGAGRGSKRPSVPMLTEVEEREPFQCSLCDSDFISLEDLHCHNRRCHVHRSWRRGGEDVPRPAPSVAGRSVSEKRVSLGGNPSRSIPTDKEGPDVLSKEQQAQQLADEAAPAEAPARPAVPFTFDLNVPVPEEEEKKSSG